MESEIVCFDFDGTIADTFSLSFAMHKILNPSLTEDTYRAGFDDNQNHISSRIGDKPELQDRFWHAYRLKIAAQPPIPNMVEIITHLSGLYTLHIISSSHTDPILAFLEHHDIFDCFQSILGIDIHPNKTHKLLQVTRQHRVEPSEIAMITDTLGDIKAARAAGVSSIAVAWGYHDESKLAQGKPAALLEEPDQLPAALEEFFDFSSEYDTH